MPRKSAADRLATKTSRKRLACRREPHWQMIQEGRAIGYRRMAEGQNGSWIARRQDPKAKPHRAFQALGFADDISPADGVDTLNYAQAQEKAREWFEGIAKAGGKMREPLTVAKVVEAYMADYVARGGKSLRETTRAVNAHILPPLGDVLVADLTTARLSDWLRKLATSPAQVRRKAGARKVALRAPSNREGASNARRATANRILTVLKAALNLAYREGRVPSDDAWRRVKPYQDADSARIRFLDDEECKRLVNSCEPDFRALVTAAILTGCRYSELCLLQVGDVILAQSQLIIRDAKGRKGKSRLVSLTPEARGLFADLVAGKARGAIVFTRADGLPWGENWQVRPLLAACEAANIVPPISFHILRHTHGSRLARMGTEIRIIAEQLGHKDTRITLKHYAHLMPEFVGDRFREKFGDMGLVE